VFRFSRHLIVIAVIALSVWIGHGFLPPDHSHNPADYLTVVGDHMAQHASVAEAAPLAAQHEGVEVCTDHDKTVWHPLVKRDAAGAITCTYTHEHHDDPSTADDIFGPVGSWYGGTQSISYPWQTSGAAGLENDAKHEGYKWYVAKDINLPCAPHQYNGCIIGYRAQVHAMGSASDAIVRFHSFNEEVLVEMNGQRGIFRLGGHMDTGHLAMSVNGGGGLHVCPALPDNPPTFNCNSGPFRETGSANVPAPYKNHNQYFTPWYAAPLGPQLEMWGPVDYTNPSNQLFYGPGGQPMNNSRGRIGDMNVITTYSYLNPYRDASGKVTFSGYTNRARQLAPGCTAIGSDCFPVKYEAVPNGSFMKTAERNSAGQILPPKEFDVFGPNGKSMIRFPN
jgi:hypothetical protein